MSNKKINLRNIIKKSTILTGAMALSFGIIALNYNSEDPYFSKHRSNYNGDLAYIKDATVPVDETYITLVSAAVAVWSEDIVSVVVTDFVADIEL